ncbi:hypothetical protein [Brevibacillus sp. 1238]|uniref:hypothetical protein n=1 Tax=Brevibacillus sp. 1238 TaxID=2940565 RepID=UPI002472E8FD|nr:hypothetical protein [Brevibacillus sp. 1238]MDH6351907.1 hypothetical protein [Brevibacillus sp. 1238]
MRDAEKDMQVCEAATDGPWHTQTDGRYSLAIVSIPEQEVICFTDSFGAGVHDGRLIAEARTALPYWIRRADAAEAEVVRLKKSLHFLMTAVKAGYRAGYIDGDGFGDELMEEIKKITV